MKLIVLGPSQSGKTCLAVGLANTSYGKALFKSAFVATAKGKTSRDHLTELRLMLEGAEWPGGTKDSKAKTLDFEFQWKNDKVEFSFDDYNGENVTQKDFRVKLENLSEEDGVALLVNPGFSYFYVEEPTGTRRLASDGEIVNGKTDSGLPLLTASAFDDSPLARKWLVGLEKIYEQLIEDLATRNGGSKSGTPIVALTVTASDRLGRDLSENRPRFEAFLEKIKTKLNAGCFKNKTFEVSITGELADQAKPKLANGFANTSAKPFLWLLRKLTWRIRFQVWKKRIVFISALAAGIALCVGIYAWVAADKDVDNILGWEVSCKNYLIKAKSNSNVGAKVELCKAIGEYKKLRGHNGFRTHKASEIANRLENEIWHVQKKLIEDRVRFLEGSQGEHGDITDCNEVESLFSLFTPSSPSNAVAKAYVPLYANWEKKKPSFLKVNTGWRLMERVMRPLRKYETEHGESVIAKLYPLYDEIRSIESKSNNVDMVKMGLASNIDSRVETEWCKFAIPDFEKAASTNASHEVTRKFVTLLESWKPVTTNGVAAKAQLYASVTNSVPRWRKVFEQTFFQNKIGDAVRSDDLGKLASLYPDRVMERGETNDYLTIGYVSEQWKQQVLSRYEGAYSNYIANVVKNIERRSGRPELTTNDKNDIEKKARTVGKPFDATATESEIKKLISYKAEGWNSDRKAECVKWVRECVRADRERTGRSSLWSDYVTFMRNNHDDNPFAESVVRRAVYQKVEKWFEDDCSFFEHNLVTEPIWQDSKRLQYNFVELEDRFNKFSRLCEEVFNDKNPDRDSWAYHFANYCVEKGHVREGIFNAFPLTLVVSSIRGNISYYDDKKGEVNYPTNYKGTSFAARIEVIQRNKNGSASDEKYMSILPFDANGIDAKNEEANSCDKDSTSKVLLNDPILLRVHLFEEVRLISSVTDWNGNLIGKTNLHSPIHVTMFNGTRSLDQLKAIDLSFELKRWTGCAKPKLQLLIEASVDGDSLGDLLYKAKQMAKQK